MEISPASDIAEGSYFLESQKHSFKGSIDELNIYRNALPLNTIIDVVNNAFLFIDLAGWWRFVL